MGGVYAPASTRHMQIGLLGTYKSSRKSPGKHLPFWYCFDFCAFAQKLVQLKKEMVLLEQNTMEQLGIGSSNASLNFSFSEVENIKQELCLTSPAVSDKENQQHSGDTKSDNNNRKRPGLYQQSTTPSNSALRGLNPQSTTAIAKPKQTGRRNARERNRVRYLNMTFEHLRQHLPQKTNSKGKAKKMSKVDTLRSAIDYIRGLQELLDDYDAVDAVFQSAPVASALSEADALSPTHSVFSADGSPCSLSGQSPPAGGYSSGAPNGDYSLSTSADSALFSEEDADDFIDITSWLQC